MVGMGYSQEEIQESLSKMKYDEITATYLLLGRKSAEVRVLREGQKGQSTLHKQKQTDRKNCVQQKLTLIYLKTNSY